jgi:hypothetical protein
MTRAIDPRASRSLSSIQPVRRELFRSHPRPERPGGGRGHVEIVRHPEGPVEIKLSGLIEAAEGRVRRWRSIALAMLVGLVVTASLAVAALALRWDYQRGRTVQLLQNDLQVARVVARCWETLARHAPKNPQEVIPGPARGDWVRRCVATELARVNPSP